MCKTSINRRNILRVVKDEDAKVTGRTLWDCAIDVNARLKGHPANTQKVFEVLKHLEYDLEVVLQDAWLRVTTEDERHTLRKAHHDAATRRHAARRRTAAHLAGGIKGLTPIIQEPPEDPEWDADEPTEEELEYEHWAAGIHKDPIPPAGGWEEDLAELEKLTAEQLADWASQKDPVLDCCGLPVDFAEAGIDERQLVS